MRARPVPRLDFAVDFVPGEPDENGVPTGGSETMSFVAHDGGLFAAMGCWNSTCSPQVLVKTSAHSPWRVDHTFVGAGGTRRYWRVDALEEIVFTTDRDGAPLAAPVPILLASTWDAQLGATAVWSRDDSTGEWTRMALAGADPSRRSRAYARKLISHVDRSTGVHSVFALAAWGAVYRGVYDPAVSGRIAWDPTPELAVGGNGSDPGRLMSSVEANGKLYVAVGEALSGDGDGGLYVRDDGPSPAWRRVFRWAPGATKGIMRGLTAVRTRPRHWELLGALEDPGVIKRIDPTDYSSVDEIDLRARIRAELGEDSRPVSIAAYNDMTPWRHPDTGELLHVIGLWARPANDTTPPTNGSHYLVRHRNGQYDFGRVFDSARPVPGGQSLRATRAVIVSPFAEDAGRVLYFGGYDAAQLSGEPALKVNTAWIYRAFAPPPMRPRRP